MDKKNIFIKEIKVSDKPFILEGSILMVFGMKDLSEVVIPHKYKE